MFSGSRVLYICIKINGESFTHDKLSVKVVLSKNYGPIQISNGEISKRKLNVSILNQNVEKFSILIRNVQITNFLNNFVQPNLHLCILFSVKN